MPEKKIKHMEMIEAIIERMAKNSFQYKRLVDDVNSSRGCYFVAGI